MVVLVVDNARDGGGEGHDRYTIGLSLEQTKLCESVLALGKPTVLVLVNGGAISIDALKDSAPAILEAFMPVVHGGTAIAETLVGHNNPGGKLPITIYHSKYVDEIDFLSMDMTTGLGRSYQYYTGVPLFPFGFGLSYTQFALSQTSSVARVLRNQNDKTTFEVKVTNVGNVVGDEVVLAYFSPDADHTKTGVPVVKKQLFDFTRVNLAPGESKTLSFTIAAKQFALVDIDGNKGIYPGTHGIIFSRGHGKELKNKVSISVDQPIRLSTFRKWWSDELLI